MDCQEAIEVLKSLYPLTCKMMDGRLKGGFKDYECDAEKALSIAISAMQELEEYQQLGTLEEVREAMEKQKECKDCGYKNHSDRISELNSCNDCGLANICEKRPEYGQYCRINCYDWRCRNDR